MTERRGRRRRKLIQGGIKVTERRGRRRRKLIQGGIEVTERRGRRRRKLLDDLKERRGYYHLKEEALDRTKWRARFGRGFGPVVTQTAKRMNVPYKILKMKVKYYFSRDF